MDLRKARQILRWKKRVTAGRMLCTAAGQTSASYSAVGISALKWVPLLKIVFEAIYYASFPLAMLMMMTPMVWTVLKGYFGGFVWLAAWDPLTAVLHSIVMKASSGYYREAMGSYSVSGGIDYRQR